MRENGKLYNVPYDPTMKNVKAIVGYGKQGDPDLRRDMNKLVLEVKKMKNASAKNFTRGLKYNIGSTVL